MKKIGVALMGVLKGLGVGLGLFFVLALLLSLIFKNNISNFISAIPSCALIVCPIVFCIHDLKKDSCKNSGHSYKTNSYYGSVGSSVHPRRTTQTQVTRPANTYTNSKSTSTITTRSATQRPVQPTPKFATQTSSKPTTSSPNGLIAKDFISALPGALKGLLAGFALFFVFSFIANLTLAHPITNLFGILGVLCLFGCTIASYVISLKEQPHIRTGKARLKTEEQAYAARLEKSLKDALDILNCGCGVTQESIGRYDDACNTLVYQIANAYFDHRYKHIVDPYRTAIYERTWPVFNWRNGKYEPAIGEELSDRLHSSIEKKANERREEYERNMRKY